MWHMTPQDSLSLFSLPSNIVICFANEKTNIGVPMRIPAEKEILSGYINYYGWSKN